ncbi:FMN-binding negative transcriptional regulator [Rossellomorea aquimaris]|uniref:FMN-binding negative transcriptional regulator n=1 Tax=Rossellomorea aquimaris TaxID=189382 RepID=UPI0007D063F5|nr:FMN-binding negative transcriptional regulator [Rossellomorea aquimaris]
MYIPKDFSMKDNETLMKFMEENSFATIFSQHNGRPSATQLPLYLDRKTNYLYGHFAKGNPQWKDLMDQELLVLFQGPHAYISPSWYESNQTVPTWNYVSVQVKGQAEVIENEIEIIHSLSTLVSKYEGKDSSYSLDGVDEKTKDGLRKGIVAFKIKIDSIEGKAKLSQNHSKERQALVIEELEKQDDDNSQEIASLMKENLRDEK